MKTTLIVDIVAPKGAQLNGENVYFQIEKEIELSFLPSIGTYIALDVITKGNPNSLAFNDALKSGVLVTGVFEIDRVYYRPQREVAEIHAREGYSIEAEARAAVRLYKAGYGFSERH